MSTNYSSTNQSYKHLSEAERGKIETYLCLGIKPAEIARRLGRNRSTITREISRASTSEKSKWAEGLLPTLLCRCCPKSLSLC